MTRQSLLGLAFLLVGFGALGWEMHGPPAHSGHVYLFAGFAVFGAYLLMPSPVLTFVDKARGWLPWGKSSGGELP